MLHGERIELGVADTLRLDGRLITSDMFDNYAETMEYKLVECDDEIDKLIGWIAENTCDTPQRKADKVLMKQDLKFLMSIEDDCVFSSINTNDYISMSVQPVKYEELCNEIEAIAFKDDVATSKLEAFNSKMENLLNLMEGLLEDLPSHGDTVEDCQKLCLVGAVGSVWANLAGTTEADMMPKVETEED